MVLFVVKFDSALNLVDNPNIWQRTLLHYQKDKKIMMQTEILNTKQIIITNSDGDHDQAKRKTKAKAK